VIPVNEDDDDYDSKTINGKWLRKCYALPIQTQRKLTDYQNDLNNVNLHRIKVRPDYLRNLTSGADKMCSTKLSTPKKAMDEETNKSFHTLVYMNPTGFAEGESEPGIRMTVVGSEYPTFYQSFWTEPDFSNPTNDNPMRASEFLSKLNLDNVLDAIGQKYGNKKWHFRYPPEAMIKALVFKYIKGLRHDTRLVRYLKAHPEEAKLLGFIEVKGELKIPSQQTFNHFVLARLRNEGLYDIFDSLVLELKDKMSMLGLQLGKTVSVDSTPLSSMKNDKDAKYNPHYDIKGYKVHNVIDADFFLPLALNFTTAIDGDSPQYLPLLDRLHTMGFDFGTILADGAYASLEHFAIVHRYYRAKAIFKLKKNNRIRKEGTLKGIKKRYESLWKKDGYKPDAGIDYMLAFLYFQGDIKAVGSYYHNKHFVDWTNNYDEKKKEFNQRAGIEAFHGHLKYQMNLEIFLDKKGIRNAEMHVQLTYISLLCVALCRVQHGVTEGLVNVKCLV